MSNELVLTELLASEFSAGVKRRAAPYADEDSIEDATIVDGWASATIYGTHAYDVELDWSTDDQPGSCTCPFFDKWGPCKHMWALAVWVDSVEDFGSAYSEEGFPERSGADRQTREPWEIGLDALRVLAVRKDYGFTNPWKLAGGESEVRYELDRGTIEAEGTAALNPRARSRLNSGKWGKFRAVTLESIDPRDLEKDEERRLHALLLSYRTISSGRYSRWGRSSYGDSTVELESDVAAELLPRLAAQGCLVMDDSEGELKPLEWDDGEPWRLERVLDSSQAGSAVLRADLVRGGERISFEELRYVSKVGLFAVDSRLAKFDSEHDWEWILQLARGDGVIAVPQEHADSLRELSRDIAPLNEREGADELIGEPEPLLHIEPFLEAPRSARVACRIQFQYGPGAVVHPSDRVAVISSDNGDRIRRNIDAEEKRISQYVAVGGLRSEFDRRAERDGALASWQVVEAVRVLLAQGWKITAEKKSVRASGTFSVSVRSGIDWFDLEGGLTFGEQKVSFPELLRAHKTDTNLIELDDGTFGIVPEDWLKQWNLIELADSTPDDALRFRGNQGWLLDMLLAGRDNVELDAQFKRYRKSLARFDGVPPRRETRGFVGELRDYQRDGVGWFAFLRNLGLGGCLADDMGLGKTVQVLALLESRRRTKTCGPTLIVAPRSLIFNWIDETARFAPKLRVLDYTGVGRRERREQAGKIDLLLTTYGTLRRDILTLSEETFDYVVLDEATAIKNPASQASKAARLLKAENRLTLTGTPIENHVGELWSQLEFLNPGMLGRSSVFQSLVGKGIEPERRAELAKALRPFVLRRTKDEVLTELPPKSEQIVICELSKKEERRYADLRRHYQSLLLGGEGASEAVETGKVEGSKIQVLEALLRLRQAACHPGLLDSVLRSESSAKLEVLLPRLAELADEGHKVLVFSQFTTFLGILRERLDDTGIAFEYLDGRTRDRRSKVERFESDPDIHVFLISLKAGGHGLNLTSADFVFLLDPWWNPAVESQAVDRAHRMGQIRPVFAYRLIAKGTVEEHVLKLQDEKRALAESLLGDGQSVLRDLTREDLAALLS